MTRFLLPLLLCSCSMTSALDDVAIPVSATAVVVQAVADALPRADLDGDGVVSGLDELTAFVLALYSAVEEVIDDA